MLDDKLANEVTHVQGPAVLPQVPDGRLLYDPAATRGMHQPASTLTFDRFPLPENLDIEE